MGPTWVWLVAIGLWLVEISMGLLGLTWVVGVLGCNRHGVGVLDSTWVKINYDGAIFLEEGRAGLVVVCSNSDGVVTASLSEQISLPVTITQVEALAARKAAVFVVDLGITSAVLEGDSDIVYKDLSSTEPSLALHGHIIHDVK
nr:hypothetical protein CFP56_29785 [Quercus suber]